MTPTKFVFTSIWSLFRFWCYATGTVALIALCGVGVFMLLL